MHKSLLDMYPHRLHVSTQRIILALRCSSLKTGRTLCFLSSLDFIFHLEGLARMDDVDDRTGSRGL